MGRAKVIVLAGLLFAMNKGCGTMANLEGKPFFAAICVPTRPPIPMGGAGTDLFVIGNAFVRPLGGMARGCSPPRRRSTCRSRWSAMW